MRFGYTRLAATFAVSWLVLAQIAAAQQYTYTTLDFPGAQQTSATGLNDSYRVVGNYQDSSGTYHGFL